MTRTAPVAIAAFKAEAAISKFRIVVFGAADSQILTAASATEASIGVTTDVDIAINETGDVVLAGPARVVFGGNVTRGAALTSDSTGRAVAAAPSAGANVRIIGFALNSGVAGDIGYLIVSPSVMQGA